MHALYLVIPALAIGVLGYRYYSAFIAAKALSLDDSRETPSHQKYDGSNFYPTPRWVLFGHHFAAITGAGPLLGPVLAAEQALLLARPEREQDVAGRRGTRLEMRKSLVPPATTPLH